MAKDGNDAPAPEKKEPTRLETLRARLREVATDVKVERVAAVPDSVDEKTKAAVPGSKAHVKASWGRHRVAHVVEGDDTLDAAECAVLQSVIAHHTVS